LRRLIRLTDTNNDGRISYAEFEAMINATSVETMAEEVNDEVLSSDDERTYGGLGKVKEGAFEIEDDE
jgi:Ca2+-binding EF-hand superfamily protein